MIITILQDIDLTIDEKILQGLSITITVTQSLLFIHFTIMIVYFYRMGLWYVMTLRSDQEHLNLFLCKLLFLAMSLLLILVSFAQFIVLSYLFIVNSFDDDDSLGWRSGALRQAWQGFEAVESVAPLFIG